MKNLDKAIQHCIDIAESGEKAARHIREKMSSGISMENARECEENAAEYRQIVVWLTALQKIDIIIDEDVGNMLDYEVLELINGILRDVIPH
jgi:hypothetical protein